MVTIALENSTNLWKYDIWYTLITNWYKIYLFRSTTQWSQVHSQSTLICEAEKKRKRNSIQLRRKIT